MENPLEKINAKEQLQSLEGQFRLFEALANLPEMLKSMRQEFDSLKQQIEFLEGGRLKFIQEYDNYVNRTLEGLDESRFWESDVCDRFTDRVCKTIPLGCRPLTSQGHATRFLTMINLKGGVGKTTLSLNLACAFATGNYNAGMSKPLKVLIVDLDFQGSMTRLCLNANRIGSTKISNGPKSDRTTSSWLLREASKRADYSVADLVYSSDIDGAEDWIDVIAADEYLDEIDVQQIVAQVMGGRETRFEYRQLFYQPEILSKYDLVIFDCPPRITPSSINALLVSDYVIIPTRLDKINSDATARTLKWLDRIQKSFPYGDPVQLAGVIVNFAKENPPPAYLSNLNNDLNEYVKDNLGRSRDNGEFVFEGQIKMTVNATYPVDGGEKKRPLALKHLNLGQDPAHKIQEAFGILASEVYSKLYQGEKNNGDVE